MIAYSSLTETLSLSASVSALTKEEAHWLLYALLKRFDPHSGPNYEEYQRAAEVILKEAQPQ